MDAHIAAIFRHPIKGFTPEALRQAHLSTGACFPDDRLFAVENGPSGFDPDAPKHVSKQKFTVLAALPAVARVRTRYEDGRLKAQAPDSSDFDGDLASEVGRTAFATWLGSVLGEDAHPDLKVIQAPGHRFMDHPKGHVSIVNLASVRDLEARMGRPVDPLRFRANLYVEGWPAWCENDWTGKDLMVGFARVNIFAPIVRCAATEVDPDTGVKDMDLVKVLFDAYGHMNCGIYVHVTDGGQISVGDACTTPQLPK